jgi:hypothetical protein
MQIENKPINNSPSQNINIQNSPNQQGESKVNQNFETLKNYQKSQEITIPDFDSIKKDNKIESENNNIVQPSI